MSRLRWIFCVSVLLGGTSCSLIRPQDKSVYLRPSLSSPDPKVRALTARVMGKTEDEKAVEPLIGCLTDEDPAVRREAANALANLTGKEFGEEYEAWLTWYRTGNEISNPSPEVGAPKAVSPAGPPSEEEQSTQSERESVQRFVEMGSKAVPSLVGNLNDPDPELRRVAVSALALIGDERGMAPIIVVLSQDADESVRAKAAGALGMMGGAEAEQALIGALSDSSEEVRYFAVTGLRWVGNAEAVAPLIKSLEDPDALVSSRALMVLRHLTGQQLDGNPSAWQQWYLESAGAPKAEEGR